MKKDKIMTYFCDPEEIMDTEYGVVTYRKWCEFECVRINKSNRGDHIKVVENKTGKIAICRERAA